ncbi:MAG: transketolase, partial [Muribaculaceae bacterium]|nr:transketolase [Muribaculaceae bacterium]
KIVCGGGGCVYGALGMSHHATEDIAILRSLPDVAVICPADLVEAEEATKAIVNYPGTVYLRLGRGGEKRIHNKIDNFTIGKSIKVKEGKDVAIFSTGAIFEEINDALPLLNEAGINPTIYTFPTVKPLDEEVIKEVAKSHSLIVTCEEHNVVGGFGSAVAEVLSQYNHHASLLKLGLNDCYTSAVGSQKYLRGLHGLNAEGISNSILSYFKKR